MHWFPKHGKSMDDFRLFVQEIIDKQINQEKPKEANTLIDKKFDTNGNPVDNTPEDYARSAIEKAVAKGILKGNEVGNLILHGGITRQDMLVILDRLGLI
jgi:hypothetical protein